MSTVISLKNVSKVYRLYKNNKDRLLEAIRINKVYHKKFAALNNINLEVKKGDILGLVGANGSGKSTLLKIISQVIAPTTGELFVDGSISALLELGTGFNPNYSGLDNIYLYGQINGKDNKEIDGYVDDIIKFANIGEFIHQPVKTYSSGMFARLAFSVAVNVNPDILIVDEALSVGDSVFQHKSMLRMKDIMTQNKTVIFVSHDLESVKNLCTRAIYLKDGSIVAEGEPQVICDMYQKDIRKNTFNAIENKIDFSETDISQKQLSLNRGRSKFDKIVSESPRYGTYDAKILNVEILNIYNQPQESFNFNDKIKISILVQAYKRIENINCCVLIRNKNGVDITGTTTYDEKMSIKTLNEGEFVNVIFEFYNHLKHDMSYSVSATINTHQEYSECIVYDHIELCGNFVSIYNNDRPVWYAYHENFDISII